MTKLTSQLRELQRRLTTIDPRPDLTYRWRGLIRRGGTFQERLRWDAFERPHYAYGVYQAALQARALGLQSFTAVELGVAGGAGLVALEGVAHEVHGETGIRVDVMGFDGGGGMPDPIDYRDLPWLWQPGQFMMDAAALRRAPTDRAANYRPGRGDHPEVHC